MSLTDTLIGSHGEAAPVVLREALRRRGQNLASQYAPGGTFREPAEDIGDIILAEARGTYGPEYELNAEGMSVQINEETAGLQSAFWIERNNPGGIGAVDNNPDLALRFPSQQAGIHAHACHLRNYAFGRGAWSADDPRTEAIAAEENRRRSRPQQYPGDSWRMFGACRTFADLQGRWATSSTYTASLESIWTFLRKVMSEMQQTAQIPGFLWHPADLKHYTPGRTAQIIGGAQHYSDGKDSLAWLSTTSGVKSGEPVSATFLVKHNPTMEDRGWQMVRIEDTSWTTGGIVNPKTVAIEYEHDGQEPIPDIAYDVLSQTWFDVDQYLAAHPGLGAITVLKGHKEWVEQPDRVCPDGVDVERIWNGFLRLREPAPPELYLLNGDGTRNPNPIIAGFRSWCVQQGTARNPSDLNAGILSVTGYALEPEYITEDGSAQEFERMILTWTRGVAPPFDIVPLHRTAPKPERKAG